MALPEHSTELIGTPSLKLPAPAANVTAGPGLVPGSLSEAKTLLAQIEARCNALFQGREEVVRLVLTSLLADGHVLLEDHPGSGKTTLAKALGGCFAGLGFGQNLPVFRRIQFTPDLLPSDVTGVTTYDPARNSFEFHRGPILANVVLADEINRASPKVQAALLEAMAEKQVTVDDETHALGEVFFVIATQNPLDQIGTYPLPRAQLDRFLFKIRMQPLSRAAELAVLAHPRGELGACVGPVTSPEAVAAARRLIAKSVHVSPLIHELLVDVAAQLRTDRRVAQGTSTRCLVQALPALQTWALLAGRDHVIPSDVRDLAIPLFFHRLELAPPARDADQVVKDALVPALESAARATLGSFTGELVRK
jgi:MoxR-like ATPase